MRGSVIRVFAVGIGLAAVCLAQESRGTIIGVVKDAQGAVVPGAAVQVLNTQTGVRTPLSTNAVGLYQAPYLNPGTYSVSVEMPGFKKFHRDGIELRVADRLEVNVTLEVGSAAESVTISAEAPLVESTTATTGQVIDSRMIDELPLGDGTAYSLIRLAPGMTFTGGYALQRPMDNGNLAGMNVGGAGKSEFSIDGSSNIVYNAQLGISPPVDSIQEFKVQTTAYDASLGHTGAGSVDLALKSGTNSLHGAAYYFNRSDARSANDFQSNRIGSPVAPRDYFRWGGTASGPIVRNKTFFMGSYEKLQDDQVEPVAFTVPTDLMRAGNLSQLTTPIYDPASAVQSGNKVVRTPFAGNIVPTSRINPIAASILTYWPKANFTSTAANGFTGNYSVQQPWNYHYNLQMGRVDHQINDVHRIYLRAAHNWREEARYDWAGVQNGYAVTKGPGIRVNWNLAVGYTAAFNSSTILDVKASFVKFNDNSGPAETFDNSKLGFPAETLAYMRGHPYWPVFKITDFGSSNSDLGRGSPAIQPFYNYSFTPTFTKLAGSHTLRVGYDFRSLRQNATTDGNKAGTFTFDSTYMKADNTAASTTYSGLAAFLLGQPTSGSFDTKASYAAQSNNHGFYIQDDWRVNERLTLNLGLRYELEMPPTERYNRTVRSFDLNSVNPIQAQAQAAYAATAFAELPAADFKVLGGYMFASAQNRGWWKPDRNNVMPRVGAAFKLDKKTVLRAGLGLFTEPFQMPSWTGVSQVGFSRPTAVTVTSNSGLSFIGTLTRPFPAGTQLLEPVGSSLALATNLGASVGTVTPLDRRNAQYWHVSFGAQRELPGNMVFEGSYAGQFGRNIQITRNLNYTPQKYRSTLGYRDNAVESNLGGLVANPFKGLMPDTPGYNGNTLGKGALLVAYPAFSSSNLNIYTYEGKSTFHSAMGRLEKRFSHGLSLLASFTYSSLHEDTNPLNPWEGLEHRVSPSDRPYHVVMAGVGQFPFGRNRAVGRNWNRFVDAFLGGWTASGNYNYQTGAPFTWGNIYYDYSYGDPKDLKSNWGKVNGKKTGIDTPAWDITGFYFRDSAVMVNGVVDFNRQVTDSRINVSGNNVRKFPTVLPDVRDQNNHSLDVGLSKTFRFGERYRVQVRGDAINALNYTMFRGARQQLSPRNTQFGLNYDPGASTVVMRPRDIQLGIKFTF